MPEFSPIASRSRINTPSRSRLDVTSPDAVVAAERVDAYTTPEKAYADPMVDNLIAISKGVDNYRTFQDNQKDVNKAQAKADFQKGTYDGESSFLNNKIGYDLEFKTLDGEARMLRARDAAETELVAKNFFAGDPDAPQKIKEIRDSTYQQQFANVDPKDVYTFAGASAHYHASEAAIDKGYQTALWKKRAEVQDQNISTITSSMIKDIHDPYALREALANIRHSIDPTLTPPSEHGQLIVNKALAEARRILNDPSIELEDRQEKADVIFESLKLKDKDGVDWYNMLTAKGALANREAVEKAEEYAVDHILKEEERIEAKNQKIYQDNMAYYQGRFMQLTKREDVLKAIDYLDTLEAEGELDSTHATHLRGIMMLDRDSQKYIVEDPTKTFNLLANVLQGRVHKSDIGRAVAAQEIQADTGAKMLQQIEMIDAKKEALSREGRVLEAQTYQQDITNNLGQINNIYRSDKDDPETKVSQAAVQDAFWDYVKQGKSPTDAKRLVIQEFGSDVGMIGNSFKTAEEAKAAYRMQAAGKVKLSRKQLADIKFWRMKTGG